mmetsp:Transcript_16292/g.42858  ORF Transcript_16292/g.42858 Transcript_16292/m.42858 type:complete len:316 (-) Transcript_16292:21-968(-)
MCLQNFQSFSDEFSKVHALALAIIDFVANVGVVVLEDVQHWQNLPVVRDQRLPDHVAGLHQGLDDLQNGADDDRVPGVQCRLQRDDELRHHRQDLRAALLEHVVDALNGQEAVRLLLLPRAVEEDRQVVVEVQLLDVDLPSDSPAANGAVHDGDGQIAAVVEDSELRRGIRSRSRSTGLRWRRRQAAGYTAEANEGRVHCAGTVVAASQPCAGHAQGRGRGASLQGAALSRLDLHVLPGIWGQVGGEVSHAGVGAEGGHAVKLGVFDALGTIAVDDLRQRIVKHQRRGGARRLRLTDGRRHGWWSRTAEPFGCSP